MLCKKVGSVVGPPLGMDSLVSNFKCHCDQNINSYISLDLKNMSTKQ